MERARYCNNDRFCGSVVIVLETLEAYNVRWNVFLVLATENRADGLKRVPKHWLKNLADSVRTIASSASKDFVEHSHSLHHCGMNATQYFARQVNPEIIGMKQIELRRTVESANRLIAVQSEWMAVN